MSYLNRTLLLVGICFYSQCLFALYEGKYKDMYAGEVTEEWFQQVSLEFVKNLSL